MSQSKIASALLPASENAGGANATKSGTLAVAGIAGALASACCIGPLALVSAGLGGLAAGIAATFEPLRPVFIAVAFAALAFAGWKIYRQPVVSCDPAIACAQPQTDRIYKRKFWVVAAIVVALIASPYYIAYFY
jgi:mercuric ion transport protein